jgi:putative transcriptional regulator
MNIMTIYNRLKVMIAEKELREGRRLTYRTIAQETGVSTGTLTAYVNQRVNRFDTPTLEAFCRFFGCQPGDLLVFSDTPPAQ